MIILKNFSIATAGAALTAMSLAVATPAKAAFISFPPGDMVPSLVVSPTFDPLAPGGEVGTAFINKGVDFSFGGREGIFDDGDVLAFSGVSNITGEVDLISALDGRIVTPGTLSNGLTKTPINAGSVQPEPVPEPLTILGSGLALGFGSLMKRQQSRKLKKTSVAE